MKNKNTSRRAFYLKLIIIAACLALILLLLLLLPALRSGKGDARPPMPDNVLDFIAEENGKSGTEEHGEIVEYDPDSDLPSADELGEYQEVFMGGDILEDGSVAGWVLAISLKDITVNTYNEITKYTLEGDAKGCVDHVKPGDAVLVSFTEGDDGTKTAYEVGRVRTEDGARTKDEIEQMYNSAEQ